MYITIRAIPFKLGRGELFPPPYNKKKTYEFYPPYKISILPPLRINKSTPSNNPLYNNLKNPIRKNFTPLQIATPTTNMKF